MFYLLLIIPHLLALGALLAYAYYSGTPDAHEQSVDGAGPGLGSLPPAPPPPRHGSGPPLPDAAPPRRRIHAGERLAELYPPPPRRPHVPEPHHTPAEQ